MSTYRQLPIAIPNIFSEIVEKTKTELDINLQFKHGTWLHLLSRLINEQNGRQTIKANMYPLICLIHDFEEKYDADSGLITTSLDFIILTPSKIDYTSEQRYIENYIPILYPIYAEFMQQIADYYGFIGHYSEYPEHTKIDALHIGQSAENGNIAYKLPDILDGIIVKGVSLTIDKAKCTLSNNLLIK